MNTPESLEEAKKLLSFIDQGYPDKLVAPLLRLEILGMEKKPDAQIYFDGKLHVHSDLSAG